MAIILAAITGNYSNPLTWTGGVVPGPGDIAVANGKTVTIDLAEIVVASIRTTDDGGATAGGSFALSLPATTISGSVISGAGVCVSGLSAGRTLSVTGGVTGGVTQSSSHGIQVTGGTCTVNGNCTGGAKSTSCGINVVSGICTVNGNCTGGSGGSASGILVAGGTCTVNGDCTGGSSTTSAGVTITGGSCAVSGNALGGTASSAYGIHVNGTGASCSAHAAISDAGAPGVYVNAGLCNLHEALGNGYGPGGAGANIVSAFCTNSGRLAVKKITFGPLGQCPIGGNARLVPDALVPTPFYIPLDADYPAAGSGTNPAFTTATTLAQQIAATVGEILRTQP